MLEARREYSDCVRLASGLDASEPGALEDLVAAESADAAAATDALHECAATWARGSRSAADGAAGRFEQANQATLEEIAATYDGDIDRIRQDEESLAYLREAVLAAGSGTTNGDE